MQKKYLLITVIDHRWRWHRYKNFQNLELKHEMIIKKLNSFQIKLSKISNLKKKMFLGIFFKISKLKFWAFLLAN